MENPPSAFAKAWHSLKPTPASAGYALFLAVNATVIWGGVFPFLPRDFQTHDIVIAFFLAQSIAFALCLLGNAIAAYARVPRWTWIMLSRPAIPYFLGWCCLIGATYLSPVAMVLTLAGGILIGYSTAGFFIQWNVTFSTDQAHHGSADLLRGTALAPLVYFALYLIPIAMTVYLIPAVFMPLFLLAMNQARKQRHGQAPAHDRELGVDHAETYRQIMRDYWRGALCIGTIGFASGVVRSIAITNIGAGEIVNIASMLGVFGSALALFLVWQFKPLRLNVTSLFRALFPFMITAFALLPLFGDNYLQVFAGAVYAVYGCAIILMMIQCEQTALVREVNPSFVYGFFGCIVYGMHDFGFISGQFASSLAIPGTTVLATTAFVAVYVLAVAMFIGQGGMKAALSPNRIFAEHIELVPTAAAPATRSRTSAGGRAGYDSGVRDRISKQCRLVTKHYKLSDRECEIMEMFARGYSAKRVAAELLVSENTVNTHVKRMYAKLDVHKKQELIELLETFNPKALKDDHDEAG